MPDRSLLPALPRPSSGAAALTGLFALIGLMLALAAPARTLAHTHRGTCPAPSARQPRRHARACARPGHRTRARTRRAGGPVLIGPTAAKPRGDAAGSGGGVRRGAISPAPAPADLPAARCDDGSEPSLASDEETFTCDDGSEPSCADGSEFALSDDGSKLVCSGSGPGSEPDPEPEAGEGEDGGEPAGDSSQPSSPASSQRSSGS